MKARDRRDADDDELANLSEEEFEGVLRDAIEEYRESYDVPRLRVETFGEAGLLTSNHGLVVRIGRAEFQVTIVRSR